MQQFTLHKVTAYTDNWEQPNVTEYWILDASGEKAATAASEVFAKIIHEALNYCTDEGLIVESEEPVDYLEIETV